MFISTLFKSFKLKETRRRIIFTLAMLAVVRLGMAITVPGVSTSALGSMNSPLFIQMLNLVSGSGLTNLSIFALGVTPFITASIVVQLLQMDIVPVVKEWGKQGFSGREKLNALTRVLTLIFAVLQSFAVIKTFDVLTNYGLAANLKPLSYTLLLTTLTAGAMFVAWIGERINEYGFGSGVSLIIFSGIIADLPSTLSSIFTSLISKTNTTTGLWTSIGKCSSFVLAVILIIWFVVWFQQAERQIKTYHAQYNTLGNTKDYLPLKINSAGVIPIIFSSSLLSIPSLLSTFNVNNSAVKNVSNFLSLSTTSGLIFYVVFIVLFTFFYTFVQMRPAKMADDLAKAGTYIINVKPGDDTKKYLTNTLAHLSTVGSLFLGIVVLLPILGNKLFGLPETVVLGGTGLIIVITVALQAISQLQSYTNTKLQKTFFTER